MVGYPGNKEGWAIPEGRYTRVYDLFLGGAGFTRAVAKVNECLNPKQFGAEANPIQRALLTADSETLDQVITLAVAGGKTLKSLLRPEWDGKGCYGEEYPESRFGSIALGWYYLVQQPFNAAYFSGIAGVEAMAAQVLLGSHGYGSNIRISSKGLNIAPNPQKIRDCALTLKSYPEFAEVHSDFRGLAIRGGKQSIALIDPMYVLPRPMRSTHKLLTSCYPDHDPYGDKGWADYWDSVSMCLQAKVGTVMVAGYYSHKLDWGIRSLASHCGYSVATQSYGAKQAQSREHGPRHGKPAHGKPAHNKPAHNKPAHNKPAHNKPAHGKHAHRLKHGERAQKADLPSPEDYCWTLQRQKQCENQMPLFEVAA